MGERVHVQHHKDRIATLFSEDADDVDCIVTVVFDNRVVVGLDDEAIIKLSRDKISEYSAAWQLRKDSDEQA
jgi:hypothetical protein